MVDLTDLEQEYSSDEEGDGGSDDDESDSGHGSGEAINEGGAVRGTPLDLSSFLFLTLSSLLSIPYALISSTSTGSLSSDCDRYGHSHVM
jgi:hypothetical protein